MRDKFSHEVKRWILWVLLRFCAFFHDFKVTIFTESKEEIVFVYKKKL